MKKIFVLIPALFLILLGTASASSEEVTLLDQVFVLDKARHVRFVRTFPSYCTGEQAVVRLINGSEPGGNTTRVSSAHIWLNRHLLWGPADFRGNINQLETTVNLAPGRNILVVLLKGKPGASISIEVAGFPQVNGEPYSLKDWMGGVDGRKLLSELSIPGTHDSCTYRSGGWVQCQEQDLAAQLDNGIRFLDIRCRNYHDSEGWKFTIHHGSFFQKMEFGYNLNRGIGVLDCCYRFLREHPSETIIMSVKEEYSESPIDGHGFETTFNLYLNNRVKYQNGLYDYDCQKLFWLGPYIPTLDQVRGKIVLLRRFKPHIDLTWDSKGIDVSNWLDNEIFDFHVLSEHVDEFHIQDKYKFTSMDDKWEDIYNTLLFASGNSLSCKWVINFSSAAGIYQPKTIAYGGVLPEGWVNPMNNRLYNILNDSSIKKTGIIVMDFPFYHNLNGFDTSVVKSILEKNR